MLYEQIEEQLTDLLGCEDSLLLPTITHIHPSVIPVLAGDRDDLSRRRAHKTIYDGCQVARSARRHRPPLPLDDPEHLDELLRAGTAEPALVCMDGVNSMTGNAPDLAASRASPASTTRSSTSTMRTASA